MVSSGKPTRGGAEQHLAPFVVCFLLRLSQGLTFHARGSFKGLSEQKCREWLKRAQKPLDPSCTLLAKQKTGCPYKAVVFPEGMNTFLLENHTISNEV